MHEVNHNLSDSTGEELPKTEEIVRHAAEPQAPEMVNYTFEIGEAPQAPWRSKRSSQHSETVLRDDTLRLFGVFDSTRYRVNGYKPSGVAADEVVDQYMSYSQPPQSTIEALQRLEAVRARTENGTADNQVLGQATITFAKIEIIQGRPYLLWMNNGGVTQILVQQQEGSSIDAISAAAQPGSVAPRVLHAGYKRNRGNNKSFGILPLHDTARIMVCSNSMVPGRGTRVVDQMEMQSTFNLDDPQDAAQRLLEMNQIKTGKSALVIDVHGAGEELLPQSQPAKPQKAKPKIIARIPKLEVTKSEAVQNAKTFIGKAAINGTQRTRSLFGRQKERVKNLQKKAKKAEAVAFAGAVATTTAAKEYFTDPEKGKRRRYVAGASVGAVALIGFAYAAAKLGAFSGETHRKAVENTAQQPTPFDTHRVYSSQLQTKPVRDILPASRFENQRVIEAKQAWKPPVVSLKKEGDGIWSTLKDYLRATGNNDSDARVSRITRIIMARRHINEEAALNLPRGWSYAVPKEAFQK